MVPFATYGDILLADFLANPTNERLPLRARRKNSREPARRRGNGKNFRATSQLVVNAPITDSGGSCGDVDVSFLCTRKSCWKRGQTRGCKIVAAFSWKYVSSTEKMQGVVGSE